ncbi:MAG: hypothetical protein B6I20_05755 [Bacteroidetes bacterium 4572_117]|nr:MAG: hypothetical protein B6I20_05755 [Bacteroidetes bacterium 4572_117]
MRYFNTSGPNIEKEHYTIKRKDLIAKGLDLVNKSRYFTIWAPRQTGKSTYFRQLAVELEKKGYKVAHINFENYRNASLESFLARLSRYIMESWNMDFSKEKDLSNIFNLIEKENKQKCVLIIDEVEGINEEYFGDFLHSIRNAYHSREKHCLKSVILVGVSNIVGVVSDNASPFNIADNLNVPYFTDEEVNELLNQHETETKQIFDIEVKNKICQITANQPGLVNGFAKKLVDDNPEKHTLIYKDYLKAEHWYLNLVIDKNIANILNKAEQHRKFIERLLFTEEKIPYKINKPEIKYLHTNGLIKEDENGYVTFWVPIYKKAVYDAFYPYTNGEKKQISRTIFAEEYYTKKGGFKIAELIAKYKIYVKRRGFKAFMEKDENGNYKSIKEASLIYSFETFITAIMQELEGKIYREADTGLGKSDMIINIANKEFLIETKVYYSPGKFSKGKEQLAYYCASLNLNKGIYLVFCPTNIKYPENVKEQTEIINDIEIITYLIEYDENKW